MCLIEIKNDVFDIVSRLKEIDKNYYVVFNCTKQRLEVHNSAQHTSTLACVVPSRTLDARTIAHVNKTKRENIDRLIKEMDEQNEKLEKQNVKASIDNAFAKMFG